MKTFMFPGQGSQARGMGAALFDEFKELTDKADKVLGYSIKELCLEDPRRELSKTQFTQPALFVVNAMSYYKKIQDGGARPDYLAGHSLGELNALLAAGCFDFEVGLKLVQKRGELMSQAPSGAMAAILNASKEQIETVLKDNGLGNIDIANYNTPAQIVISGAVDEIRKAERLFQGGKVLYYPLNTSGAFHSRFMRPAREKFQSYLKRFKFNDPSIAVIANVTARPYGSGEVVENLSRQVSSTVRWSESIQYLMALDGEGAEPMQFEEVGHGDVLTKMVHFIKQQTPTLPAADEAQPAARVSQIRVEPPKPAAPPTARDDAGAGASKGVQSAAAKVAAWNAKYPIGTKVKSLSLDYENLETRTAAVVLFGHRAAVYMKDYNGYFDLDEIAPL